MEQVELKTKWPSSLKTQTDSDSDYFYCPYIPKIGNEK